MCSHESITWEITDNFVADRMIDNSLIHKFRPSRKLRRRTKVLNTEIKKHYGMTDYKHYVELKTSVLRNLANDTDTDDNSSLTDDDYDIIYSSPSKQAKYVAENSKRHIFSIEEDCEGCKRKSQRKTRDSSTKRHVQTRKSSRMKNSMVSKKRTNVGWQEVTKKNSIIPYLHKQVRISNNEEKDNDCNNFETQPSKRSLSSRLDSPNSTVSIKNYRNGYMRQNHEESNAIDNKLTSENSTMSNETKPVSEKKVQNHKNQSAIVTESSTLVKSKDKSSNKLTAISKRSSINGKNYDNTNTSHKSELLKNVKRNLIPALEKVDSMNNDKDIETNENTEDSLNYDQLFSASNINFNRDTTLRKTQINIPTIKNGSLDTLPLDQQKDSGIDEDSQDRFVKTKESNEIVTNRNMEENAEKIPIFSPELKSDEVIETAQDFKEDEKDTHLKYSSDILKDQINKEEKEFSGEEKMNNSSQLNQIDLNVEINREDKEDEYFAITEDSNDLQKQQSQSPKQDCTKDTHSESYNHVQEEEDRKIQNSSEEEEISLQLKTIDEDTEVSSINCEGEGERQVNKEKEEKDFSQLNEVDTDAKMHSINQEDKTYVKLENTHNVEKQQILPKIMHTEVLNKKYKIIKKDNNVKNNETIDNINNNTDVANKDTPIKKNTSLCYSDISDHDSDNWQETAVNAEEIDASIALGTDNEEINGNYISPQTKKRLQQQARLNLVVNSDSSDSDNECVTTKTSRKFIDNADTNRCSENDMLKNDETNCDSKQTNIYIPIEDTVIPTEVVKLDSINVKKGITKKTESLIRYKNNDLFQFTANENSLKETQYCENVHNDDDRNEDDNFQLKVSESNVSYNNAESINQFRNYKHSPLSNKKYMYSKSNENEEIMGAEYEHNAQASTKFGSNAHINISCQYRPSNLQELVEDQELLVETMPASFTLADLSEDEEAFILNVPSKVVQCNLQGQVLTLKEKSIKFNENKYRIVQKEVGTTSCIFATDKKRKPYKIINIKKISTITVREKLPQDSKKTDVSNSYSAVSSTKITSTKNKQPMNEQIDEVD